MTNGLVALVESKTDITALIGTFPVRFFPLFLPQGLKDFPAATYRVVSTTDNASFETPSKHDFVNVDLQLYGQTYKSSFDLYETFRKELEYNSGIFDNIIITDVVYLSSGVEDYLEELELYTKQLELRIDYIRQP